VPSLEAPGKGRKRNRRSRQRLFARGGRRL